MHYYCNSVFHILVFLQANFMPHQWLCGNLSINSKCIVCEGVCGSVLRLQDFKCIWCRITVRFRIFYIMNNLFEKNMPYCTKKRNNKKKYKSFYKKNLPLTETHVSSLSLFLSVIFRRTQNIHRKICIVLMKI